MTCSIKEWFDFDLLLNDTLIVRFFLQINGYIKWEENLNEERSPIKINVFK